MSSNLSILPAHSGANLAEISPLLKIGEGTKNPSTSLQEAIKERYKHFLSHQQSTWDEMNRAGEENALFFQGKQFLMPNPLKAGGWLPYKVPDSGPRSASVRRAMNLMQYHISGNLEKWANSNPDIRVKPGVQSDDAFESAQSARIIVDHYEGKFYGPRIEQAECLEGLAFGSYIWRLRLDQDLKSVTAYRQIFENKNVKIGPGWGMCGGCGYEGSADDFEEGPGGIHTCPKCPGEALVIPPAQEEISSLAETKEEQLGDFRLDLVPFSQCRWDLRFHADESPWLIIRRRTTMSAVRQLLGNIEISGGDSSDVGLDITDRLAYSGTSTAGYSRSEQRPSLYKEPATIEEFWMSPDEYGDIQLTKGVKSVSGEEIPGNIRLGDLLKGQSICVLGLNEMSTILGIYTEDHRDYIAQGKWYAKAGTGAGRPLSDLTEVQKIFNSDHQQAHTYLRSIATPAMLVASDVLGEEGKGKYIGTPGLNIPITMAALAEGVTMEQLVRPAFQPQSVPAQFFEFTYNRLSEFAQYASHFMPFTGGLPGVGNKTATGANITQAATNALYTPVLSVKAEVRKMIAEKLIKLYPKAFPIERYFPMGGKYGSHSGKYLSGANLNTDLIFEVVQDSWNPRNSYTKRQDTAAFGQVAQMLSAIPNYLTPDKMMSLERTFDLDEESETKNVAESLCFRRVRMMQAQANVVQDPMMLVGVQPGTQAGPDGQPMPTGQLVITGQGVIQPPVSQAEPAHSVKRQWLMDWLDADDGQDAPMNLRAAVELLIKLHTDLDGQQGKILASQQGEVQLAGQQPQMQAQQEAQAAQGQAQMDQQAQGLALKGVEALGSHVANQAELRNKATEQDLEHLHGQRTNDLKAADREHGLAVDAAKTMLKGQ